MARPQRDGYTAGRLVADQHEKSILPLAIYGPKVVTSVPELDETQKSLPYDQCSAKLYAGWVCIPIEPQVVDKNLLNSRDSHA